MAGEWKVVPLGQLYDFSSGLSKPRSAFGSGYPFLGFKDVFYNSSVPSQLTELVNSTEQERARCSIRRGDVFVTRTSETMDELGMSCVVLCDIPDATFNGFTKRLRPKDSDTVAPEYARYYFRSPTFRQAVTAMSSLSTRASLNNEMLERLWVVLPPPEEQEAIGHILGTLDDKIELNRRMNETLEAMARALFKSWFVDFDPVRAKVEGRDPGLPNSLADLFPDAFEDSELGQTPNGWDVATLAKCVDVVRGLSYKGSGLSRDGVPMHNLNSIYEGGGYKQDGLKHYRGEYKQHHVARPGDVIVANTEQGHHRLLIGYAAIVPSRFNGETLFSHHIYRLRPKASSGWTPDYLRHLLNTNVMHDTVSGYANGTTVNMLPIDGLQSPKVLAPHPRIIAAFNEIAEAARKRHEEMVEESRTLAALRDTLLPKLISGELRVKEAEAASKDTL